VALSSSNPFCAQRPQCLRRRFQRSVRNSAAQDRALPVKWVTLNKYHGKASVDLATSRMRCTPRALAHRCRTKEVKKVARYQFGKVAHAKIYSIWRVGRVRLSLNMTPVGRRLDRVALAWRLPSMCGQLPTLNSSTQCPRLRLSPL